MVRRFDIEPPEPTGRVDDWEKVDYPRGTPGPGWVIPPPQRIGDPMREVTRRVGEELARVRESADGAVEGVANLGTVVADYGDVLDRKVEPWAVPTVAPLSQAINRRADATFQLSDFMVPRLRSQDGSEWRDVSASVALGWNQKNRVYLAFITPAINRAYERLHFMVGEVSDPCAMDVAVYVTDEYRVLRRQVHEVNVAVSTARSVVTVTFDEWVATQGSYVAIGFVQYGSGNARSLLGLNDTERPLDFNLVFPPRIGAYFLTSSSVLPQTIDGGSDLTFDSDWFVPYAELGEALGEVLVSHHDAFSTTGWLSRPWVTLTDQGAYAGEGSVGVIRNIVTGFSAGPRAVVYDTPLATEFNEVEVVVGHVPSSTPYSTWATVRSNNNLSSGLALWMSPGQPYQLRRWTTGDVHNARDSSVVVGQAASATPQWWDVARIRYDHGQVTVWVNDVEVISEYVGGFEEQRFRFLGLGFDKHTNGNVYGIRLEDWSARDIPAGEGEDDVEDDIEEGYGG